MSGSEQKAKPTWDTLVTIGEHGDVTTQDHQITIGHLVQAFRYLNTIKDEERAKARATRLARRHRTERRQQRPGDITPEEQATGSGETSRTASPTTTASSPTSSVNTSRSASPAPNDGPPVTPGGKKEKADALKTKVRSFLPNASAYKLSKLTQTITLEDLIKSLSPSNPFDKKLDDFDHSHFAVISRFVAGSPTGKPRILHQNNNVLL